jgi:predicted regulator of Ras-like GTPase activity (Roadblock/LC7/MglB family)
MSTSPLTAPPPRNPGEFAWLVQQFVDEVPGVTHAVVVSSDGLQLVASQSVGRDRADSLAALTATLLATADQSGRLLGLGISEYLTIRLPKGHLLFMRIAPAAGFVVAAAPGSDLRVVAYQMTHFARQAGHLLTPRMRDALHHLSISRSIR